MVETRSTAMEVSGNSSDFITKDELRAALEESFDSRMGDFMNNFQRMLEDILQKDKLHVLGQDSVHKYQKTGVSDLIQGREQVYMEKSIQHEEKVPELDELSCSDSEELKINQEIEETCRIQEGDLKLERDDEVRPHLEEEQLTEPPVMDDYVLCTTLQQVLVTESKSYLPAYKELEVVKVKILEGLPRYQNGIDMKKMSVAGWLLGTDRFKHQKASLIPKSWKFKFKNIFLHSEEQNLQVLMMKQGLEQCELSKMCSPKLSYNGDEDDRSKLEILVQVSLINERNVTQSMINEAEVGIITCLKSPLAAELFCAVDKSLFPRRWKFKLIDRKGSNEEVGTVVWYGTRVSNKGIEPLVMTEAETFLVSKKKTSLFSKNWKFKFKSKALQVRKNKRGSTKEPFWADGYKNNSLMVSRFSDDKSVRMKFKSTTTKDCTGSISIAVTNSMEYVKLILNCVEGKQGLQEDSERQKLKFQRALCFIEENESGWITWVHLKILQHQNRIVRLFLKNWEFGFNSRDDFKSETSMVDEIEKGMLRENYHVMFSATSTVKMTKSCSRRLKLFYGSLRRPPDTNETSVILMALEVGGMELQVRMGPEFDGFVMKRVHDQSNNHVKWVLMFQSGSFTRPPETVDELEDMDLIIYSKYSNKELEDNWELKEVDVFTQSELINDIDEIKGIVSQEYHEVEDTCTASKERLRYTYQLSYMVDATGLNSLTLQALRIQVCQDIGEFYKKNRFKWIVLFCFGSLPRPPEIN